MNGSIWKEKWKWKLLSCVPLFVTPWTTQSSPGQNTGMGSLSLLQGIFPTQGWNPGLQHCRQILYQLSRKESLAIMKFCNKLNWHLISLALKADVRGGKQRIVPKVKQHRNYLSLTWLTECNVVPHNSLKIWRWVAFSPEVRSGKKRKRIQYIL